MRRQHVFQLFTTPRLAIVFCLIAWPLSGEVVLPAKENIQCVNS